MKSLGPLLDDVLEIGGMVLRRYYRRPAALAAERKADGSLVTRADQEVEALLRESLRSRFPGANIVGEEGAPDYRPERPCTFAVDPIDGTAAFASGLPGWCISVGLLDRLGVPRGGIVYAPAQEQVWFADIEGPAKQDGEPLPARLPPPDLEDAEIVCLVDSKLHQSHNYAALPGKVRSLGSSALHLCLTTSPGEFALAHTLPPSAWDIAGAHAILARCGLTVRCLQGDPIDYSRLLPRGKAGDHVVAGHPLVLDELSSLIRPLQPR